jgi:hypothetical protein
MKMFRFALRAITIAIAAIPMLDVSMPVCVADQGHTPGPAEPAEVDSRDVSPYVPPTDVYVPESSKAVPADSGKRGHTNIMIRNSRGIQPKEISDLSQPEPAANPAPNNALEDKALEK